MNGSTGTAQHRHCPSASNAAMSLGRDFTTPCGTVVCLVTWSLVGNVGRLRQVIKLSVVSDIEGETTNARNGNACSPSAAVNNESEYPPHSGCGYLDRTRLLLYSCLALIQAPTSVFQC